MTKHRIAHGDRNMFDTDEGEVNRVYARPTEPAEEPEFAFDGETPREKFKRLANDRMQRTIHRIRMMHPLASSRYEYPPEDAKRLCALLRAEIDDLESVLLHVEKKQDMPSLF